MGKAGTYSFGIVGGLGALASADVFFKLAKASGVASGSTQDHLLLEQHAFSEPAKPGAVSSNQTTRKRYVFDMLRVGLLATDGTIKSHMYHEAAEKAGIQLVVPDEVPQRSVMAAIYGSRGGKAGFTQGRCRKDLQVAIEHLVRDKGAKILIRGCTELPLLVAQSDHFPVLGKHIAVLDPTEILAC